jgi:hypothetical protein
MMDVLRSPNIAAGVFKLKVTVWGGHCHATAQHLLAVVFGVYSESWPKLVMQHLTTLDWSL